MCTIWWHCSDSLRPAHTFPKCVLMIDILTYWSLNKMADICRCFQLQSVKKNIVGLHKNFAEVFYCYYYYYLIPVWGDFMFLSSFPLPQRLLLLTSKPFVPNLTYLGQIIFGSGKTYGMTFLWPWPCEIKWKPLVQSRNGTRYQILLPVYLSAIPALSPITRHFCAVAIIGCEIHHRSFNCQILYHMVQHGCSNGDLIGHLA